MYIYIYIYTHADIGAAPAVWQGVRHPCVPPGHRPPGPAAAGRDRRRKAVKQQEQQITSIQQ